MYNFISLNAKVYSFNYLKEDKLCNKKVLKGVSKAVVKNPITYEDYKNVLNTAKQIERDVTSIWSFGHQLYTYVNKQSLSNILLW